MGAIGVAGRSLSQLIEEQFHLRPESANQNFRIHRPDPQRAKRLGLSLDEIRGILQLHDLSEPTCVHVRSLLEEKVAQIEKAIQDLLGFKEELESLRDQATTLVDCRPSGGNICSIIEQSGIKVSQSSLGWAEPLAGAPPRS